MKIIDADALINEIKKETEKAIKQDDGVGAFWFGYFAGLVLEQPIIQPEYKAVKVEDFAKTMSENTIYSFMAWHSMALVELMEKQGFVICKKTM